MLDHFRRSRGAVETDHVDTEGLEGIERRSDLRAEQHRARRLDGHVRDDRDLAAGLLHALLHAHDGGLDLKEILRGFDEERVDPAKGEAAPGLRVRISHLLVRRLAEGGQLRARP